MAVRAKRVVLATGAIERPLVFGDNDRPGVMLASAVSAYLNRWAVRPGSQAVVFTNNDGAYRTALDLHAAKVPVAAVVDLRPAARGALPEQVRAKGIRVLEGSAVVAVEGGADQGGRGHEARGRDAHGPGGTDRLRPCGDVRRLEPGRPSLRPVRWQDALGRGSRLLRPWPLRPGGALGGRLRRTDGTP